MQLEGPTMNNSLRPSYRHEGSGFEADRIDAFQSQTRPFSQELANRFLEKTEDEHSTCFAAITRSLKRPPNAFDWSILDSHSTVLALSGGLDSFLIAALIKERTGSFPPAATLVSRLHGYCEAEFTLKTARDLGIKDVILIETDEEEFIESLPDVVRAAEIPLYNLHPVSKWLFAMKVKRLGFTKCLTGDGADQIFSHDRGVDYLPIVGSIFSSSGLELICPLYTLEYEPETPDREKTELRNMARRLLPHSLVNRPKKSCFTPPIDLSRHLITPSGYSDQAKTLTVTLELLKRSHL